MTKFAQYNSKGFAKRKINRIHLKTLDSFRVSARVKKNTNKLASKNKYWKMTSNNGECEKNPKNRRNQEYPIAQGLTSACEIAAST